MKRLMLPATIAFSLHGLMFGINPAWMTYATPKWEPPTPVSITLSYLERETLPKPEAPKTPTPPDVVEPNPEPDIEPAPESVKKTPPLKKPKAQSPVPKRPEPEQSPEPEAAIPRHTAQTIDPVQEHPDTDIPTAISALSPAPASATMAEPVVVEARPLYRQNPPPRYPRSARKRGYEGTVILEVLVDRDGEVEDLKLHQSSGYKVLDKAALASVRKWFFIPGRRGDEAVDMWVRVPISFRLTE